MGTEISVENSGGLKYSSSAIRGVDFEADRLLVQKLSMELMATPPPVRLQILPLGYSYSLEDYSGTFAFSSFLWGRDL